MGCTLHFSTLAQHVLILQQSPFEHIDLTFRPSHPQSPPSSIGEIRSLSQVHFWDYSLFCKFFPPSSNSVLLLCAVKNICSCHKTLPRSQSISLVHISIQKMLGIILLFGSLTSAVTSLLVLHFLSRYGFKVSCYYVYCFIDSNVILFHTRGCTPY